jgi:hypothetical protein
MLAKHSPAVPPAFVKALTRWQEQGTEARIQSQLVLRVARPEILEQIRKSRAGRFFGEVLSPTAAVIKPGASQKVIEMLMELGTLAQDETDI